MTVHWIHAINGQRKLVTLARRRIFGRHAYDVLAENISTI